MLGEFYRELLRIRIEKALFTDLSLTDRAVHQYDQEKVLWVNYPDEAQETTMGLNFSDQPASLAFPWPPGRWYKFLYSAKQR